MALMLPLKDHFAFRTHDAQGITLLDFESAARVDALLTDQGTLV
jgi:pterin-4a-carbinolamine dehydratase